ncbi:MAG TPA: PepSY domain-containing protein [Steroidobacteraceae bacterium]|jgi:hypothetical protein|nr:PepSY domain-containing protein [Steroidobacteraceae bacterium]
MRGLLGRGGITAGKANSRLALAALVLAVGASLALAAGAVRVLTLPLAPEAADEAATTRGAPAADVAAALPAQGNSGQDDQNVGNERASPPPLSRAQAVALVQRRYRARVVRTRQQQDSAGRQLYVFRLLSAGGKVWTVRIDAHSGAEVP